MRQPECKCVIRSLDLLVSIPANFSEIIIGNTEWYRLLKANNFTNLDEMIQQVGLTEIIPPSYEQYLENSDFPIGATPTLNFYANPSAIVGGISRGIVVDTLDQITMLLSGETIPNIVNISRNGIGTFNVTVFDSFLPKYLVMIMLFPLAAVAILILKEKESNTLQFVESTYTQNITHMTSIEITQFCLAVFQATIYLSLFKLFGFFFNPLGDLSCLIFTLALLSLISTNIGLIIGNIADLTVLQIGLSVLFILLFEFLGGSFLCEC